MDAESELLHKRHLACYGPEDVCILLEEMGLNRAELRRFRIARIDGEHVHVRVQAHLSEDRTEGSCWVGSLTVELAHAPTTLMTSLVD
eukprot:366546-Chlamydomonas_euryale.AAC.43